MVAEFSRFTVGRCAIIALTVSLAACSKNPHVQSVDELLANSERYDKHVVAVSGFMGFQSGSYKLFATKTALENNDYSQSLPLVTFSSELMEVEFSPMYGRKSLVVGRFEMMGSQPVLHEIEKSALVEHG